MDLTSYRSSTDLDARGRQECVFRDGEVLRRRTFSDASGRIVLRAMAMAKPSAEVTLLRRWRAAQMRAHAQGNEPLRFVGAIGVGRGRIVRKILVAGELVGQ